MTFQPSICHENMDITESPTTRTKIEDKSGWILRKEEIVNLFGVSMSRWRRSWFKIVHRSPILVRFFFEQLSDSYYIQKN